MKEIKRYEVEGYEFTDAEFAAKVELILKAYPELEFEANGNELLLPFGDDAKIFMSNRGELEIQVVDYNPSMTSREVFELADRGILWGCTEVCNTSRARNQSRTTLITLHFCTNLAKP